MKKIILLFLPTLCFAQTNLCEQLASTVWQGNFVSHGENIKIEMRINTINLSPSIPAPGYKYYQITGQINNLSFDNHYSSCILADDGSNAILAVQGVQDTSHFITFNATNFNENHIEVTEGVYNELHMEGSFNRI